MLLKRRIKLLALLFVVAFNFVFAGVSEVEKENVELSGSWNGGVCRAVAVQNDTAYVGVDGFFKIIDCSNLTNPTELGSLEVSTPIFDIKLDGNYAYAAVQTDGMLIINISDKNNPTIVSSFDTKGTVEELAVQDNFVYVADAWDGFKIVDVSDKTSPVLVYSKKIESEYVYGLDVAGSRLYAAMGNKMYVYDVYNKNKVKLIDIAYWIDSDMYYVKHDRSEIYAGYNGGLYVFKEKYENDWVFRERNTYISNDRVRGIDVSGNFVCVASEREGLRILDLSGNVQPVWVGYYKTGNKAKKVALCGDHIYVANMEDGLLILEYTGKIDTTRNDEKLHVDLAGNWNDGDSYAVAVHGDTAYIGSNTFFEIIDCTDPLNPREIGKTVVPSSIRDIKLEGDYAYVAVREKGLCIINISDKKSPYKESFIATNGGPVSLVVKDNIVFLADSYNGLVIIDVRDKTNPVQINNIRNDDTYCGRYCEGLDMNGSKLFAGFCNYLYIYNVSDNNDIIPESKTSVLHTTYRVLSVKYDENYIYIGGEHRFKIYSYNSDSLTIKQQGDYYLGDRTYSLAKSNNNVFLACDEKGFKILDVTDKMNPVEAGYFIAGNEDSKAKDVVISDNHIYVAYEDDGLLILDFPGLTSSIDEFSENGGISSFSLDQNYPNPFNPETNITYRLPKTANVTLSVFDIRGRLVKTLVDNRMQTAGTHTVVWDGTDMFTNKVTSGLYFYKINADNFSETRRCLLLK